MSAPAPSTPLALSEAPKSQSVPVIEQQPKTERVVVTFGTFDVFHIGHVLLLERARRLGTRLIVGVSSDSFSYGKKQRFPVYNEHSRMRIVGSQKSVDSVFLEESFAQKRQYLLQHKASVFVMGDDWQGKFDEFNDICQVVYLPRTPTVSTTEIIERIQGGGTP
jgi:glycerol-3-phosphate cytidylyltransferase